MKNQHKLILAVSGALFSVSVMASSIESPVAVNKPQLKVTAAEHFAGATSVKMLAATRAGKRIVAVGDYGVVLLSDDEGKSFHQAKSVPVSSTLTSVTFTDANNGWAVGHWGAILKTADGGQSWVLQRSDFAVDQPLFSVYFKNANEGWAVGLWSLMLHTADGGASWSVVSLPPPAGAKKADRNLYAIFGDAKSCLYATSEQGRVLHSEDAGATWEYAETGYSGSLWTGLNLADGALLVGGLRGTIYRSDDGGKSWQVSKTNLKSSVTNMTQRADKSIVAVGLDGLNMISVDGGVSFVGKQRQDRAALTAVIETQTPSGMQLFSSLGPVGE
ncbi:WD40/YVTN/BNR-like repeat-containing protein [Solimicrobium silvestre]|uniref:BNR/Asp-box repeat n=1 Tax=Solimicrobium silvestre TaxID=2099400 RepID=A0A2S9GW85_9BURK|nr:YCF48-related protein [Solimicrobium silvestre]PRC91987.1 BNR/Asp-box repeat [Solimicrobium silvestre]